MQVAEPLGTFEPLFYSLNIDYCPHYTTNTSIAMSIYKPGLINIYQLLPSSNSIQGWARKPSLLQRSCSHCLDQNSGHYVPLQRPFLFSSLLID
jgi:hypothetical protein